MKAPPRRFAAAAGLLAALAFAAAEWTCVVRIAPGELGATGNGWLAPGWHLRAPLARVVRLAATGEVEAGSVEAATPAGGSRRFSVRVRYRLDARGDDAAGSAAAGSVARGAAGGVAGGSAVDGAASYGAAGGAAGGGAAGGGGARAAADVEAQGHAAEGAAAGDGASPGSALATAVARRGSLALVVAGSLREALGPALASLKGTLPRHGSATDPLGSLLVAGLSAWGLGVDSLEWRRLDPPQAPPIAALPPPARHRLLIVGLDGADWQIIDPLIAQGRLPALARLVRDGVRAPLRSFDPMISPLIWTTMATGVGPEWHGVADFLVTEAGTGRMVPITSRFRRVKALWNMLSEARLDSGFVGWWASYPAEAVRGFQVSDLMGFSLLRPGAAQSSAPPPGITYPPSYYSEIRPRLILPERVTYEEVTRFIQAGREEFERSLDFRPDERAAGGAAPVQDPVWLVRRTIAATRNYEAITRDLLARGLDLVGVYFEGIDLMGHRFQHCLPPRVPLCSEEDHARWKNAVTSFYEFQDEVLGRLLDSAPGRTVLVVSDHGFRNGSDRPADFLPFTTGQPVEWHREYGILIISGPGTRRGVRLAGASVFDIAPTVLHLSGLPAGEDMPGHVLAEALDPADLARYPPRRTPSYEDAGEARSLPQAEPQTAAAPAALEAQAEMVENLQALGYVGAAPVATPPAAPTAAPGAAPGASPADSRGATPGAPSGPGASRGEPHQGAAPPADEAAGAKGAGEAEPAMSPKQAARTGEAAGASPGTAPQSPPRGGSGLGGSPGITGGEDSAPAPIETTRVAYHRNLATYYLKSGRPAQAEAELLTANRIQPLPKSYELLAEIRAARGDTAGAVASLEQGFSAFPDMDQEAILWMVDLRLREGGVERASELLERWRPRISRSAILRACEGELAAARGDGERAIALLLEALKGEPTLSQAALAAAPLLDARGRIEELEGPLVTALASESRLDEYQNLLGVVRLKQGRLAGALEVLGKALELDPVNPRFLENYTAAALAMRQPGPALERYRGALADPRAGSAAWAGYGRLLGTLRRPAEASEAFAKARAMGDRSASTTAGYALSLLESGHQDRSREIVREGLQAYPGDPALQALERRISPKQ